jgi:deazaflavin-dependent oxidoreductase (nitroreductase family)
MGLLTPVAVRIVLVDKLIQRGTGGRLTILDVAGLPNLMLTTTGRKSGLPRSNPLLCVPDGERILIAGSYFGGPTEPMWVKNLEASPEVSIRTGGVTSARLARRLEGQERAEAWQKMLATWPNFAMYEQRTNRHIKVFSLTPR